VNVADTVPGTFSVSTTVESDRPVIAERAMYWSTVVPLTPEKVGKLLDTIRPYTAGIRTFSSTGMLSLVPRMAKSRGLAVAAGCDISSDRAYNEREVQGLVELAESGDVDIAVVGEESLFFGFVSDAELVDYMRRVKSTGVPVTTSDTWGQLIAHPEVMAECDVILANVYPYWEEEPITGAVGRVETAYESVKAAAGGKGVLIQTGWPSAGDPRGGAVPSLENERAFLSDFMAWAGSRNVSYFYFEAFDEPWKASREGPVGAHWGIWDSTATLKPGMEQVIGPGSGRFSRFPPGLPERIMPPR
jgi:glycoside/pentoside/hexuronide:cation symporter, GPH family